MRPHRIASPRTTSHRVAQLTDEEILLSSDPAGASVTNHSRKLRAPLFASFPPRQSHRTGVGVSNKKDSPSHWPTHMRASDRTLLGKNARTCRASPASRDRLLLGTYLFTAATPVPRNVVTIRSTPARSPLGAVDVAASADTLLTQRNRTSSMRPGFRVPATPAQYHRHLSG